ncbi:hypothetical protein [Georgenia subflava]|uniref:hypothetical protein n=1 Tax=Georgenia subflava TaxID=1622177 RepID=UPI00186B00B7|nr:hypothetical protein [Georgenia subflava]
MSQTPPQGRDDQPDGHPAEPTDDVEPPAGERSTEAKDRQPTQVFPAQQPPAVGPDSQDTRALPVQPESAVGPDSRATQAFPVQPPSAVGPDSRATQALPVQPPSAVEPDSQATQAFPAQQPPAVGPDSQATQTLPVQQPPAAVPGGYAGPPTPGGPAGGPPYGGAAYGAQVPYGQEPEKRNTWLVPAVIGVAVVVLVAAAVFFLTRGPGAEPIASPTATAGQPENATDGAAQDPTGDAAQDSDAAQDPNDGTVQDPAGDATAPAAGSEPTGQTTEDTRVVSADPLEPRVDTTVTETEFTLTDAGWTEHGDAMAAGAREAISGTYSDGSVDVPVTAAAFESIEDQDAYSQQLIAELDESGATQLEDGPVYPDETGHFWAYLLADGVTTTVVWQTDDGVVLSLTGDPQAVPTIYSNMLI